MGYNSTTKAIDAPVSISTVARILGTNSTDVGTLCTSPLINKYSVHRPMGIDSPKELTDDEICKNNGGYTDIADMVCSSLVGVKNKYENGNKLDWATQTPVWFRLTDFIGYKHTTRDFTPIGEITEDADGKSILTLTWGADIQNYITKFAIYKSGSTNNVGFGQLGIFLEVFGDIYFVCVSQIATSNKFTTSINLDDALAGKSTGTSGDQPEKGTIKAIPVLADYGIGNGTTGVLTNGKVYTGNELNTNGQSSGQHVKAPFKFLALCGKLYTGTYKNFIYKTFENIKYTLTWVGGYNKSGDFGSWDGGDFAITNYSSRTIEVSVKLYGESTDDGGKVIYDEDKDQYGNETFTSINPNGTFSLSNKKPNLGKYTWTSSTAGQATIKASFKIKIVGFSQSSREVSYTRSGASERSVSGNFADNDFSWRD